MAKLAIKKASTDVTTYVFIQDSSKTTGVGLAGLAYNTTDLVASYVRPLGTRQALTLATLAAADSAHSDGGFKEVDATNMPGVYRLDLPDAVCATGVPSVVVMLKGATNMSPVVLEIQLTDFDLNDASPNVTVADIATDAITAAAVKADAVTKIQNGLATPTNITAGTITTVTNLTNLPNGTGTNQISLSGGKVLLQATQTGVTIPTVTTVGTTTNLTNLPTMPTDWVTAAGLKADAVTEIQAGVTLANTQPAITWAQQKIVADVEFEGALDIKNSNDNGVGKSTFGGMAGEYNYGVAAAGVYNLSEEGTGVQNKGYGFGVRNEGTDGGMYNKSTGLGGAAMFNDAQGTYGIGLRNVGGAQNVEGFDPAQATEATLTAIKGAGWSTETLAAIDVLIDAIKAKTDLIPATPAVADEYDAALAAIQSDLDNPTQYKADVSGLATTAHVQEVENKIDAIDVTVNTIPTNPLLDTAYTAPDNASIAAILEDTGTTIPATLAGLATSAEVGAITMLDEVVVGSYTMQDILKILAAKMVGKATGGGTATITYRGVDDTSDVIIETVDSNGNRSAVTLTV